MAAVSYTHLGTSAEMILDLNGTKRETLGFLELLMEFDAEYKKAKRQRGIIDFSDQEHLTAELLYDFKNRCPTPAAENVSQRYREILVDEYQDVNEVQELIFGAVSREGRNIFMVGDVKPVSYTHLKAFIFEDDTGRLQRACIGRAHAELQPHVKSGNPGRAAGVWGCGYKRIP